MEAVVSKGAAGAEMAAEVAKEVTEAGLGSVEGSAAAMVVVVMAVARVVVPPAHARGREKLRAAARADQEPSRRPTTTRTRTPPPPRSNRRPDRASCPVGSAVRGRRSSNAAVHSQIFA